MSVNETLEGINEHMFDIHFKDVDGIVLEQNHGLDHINHLEIITEEDKRIARIKKIYLADCKNGSWIPVKDKVEADKIAINLVLSDGESTDVLKQKDGKSTTLAEGLISMRVGNNIAQESCRGFGNHRIFTEDKIIVYYVGDSDVDGAFIYTTINNQDYLFVHNQWKNYAKVVNR